jgi:TolA-binding protein
MTRTRRLSAAPLLAAVLLGCGGGAKELLDTAQLEETQRNVPHARELYQELLRRYPNSPEAATAAERLKGLGEPPSAGG